MYLATINIWKEIFYNREVVSLHTSDKQALINLAVLTVKFMKNSGKTDEEVKYILSKRLNFSDVMIEQIM